MQYLENFDFIYPISPSCRIQVGQYVTGNGEVVSHLNISAVQTNDGGLYSCVAASTVGSISHSERLNVYGLPNIRWATGAPAGGRSS